MTFRMRVCRNCGLRFPSESGKPNGTSCPACQGETDPHGEPFGPRAVPRGRMKSSRPQASAVLDNLRSAWNVGSIFRTADSAGVKHLYLCGITPTPENPKVLKTSLGAERTVPWSYHRDGPALVRSLIAKGERVWGLEGGAQAKPFSTAPSVDQVTWVVGNEKAGVDPGILDICEAVYYLPMVGEKESLNVVVAFGIAAYCF